MSIVPWKKPGEVDGPDEDDLLEMDAVRPKNFPLIPSFSPPSDFPLDPNNDLIPPAYSAALVGTMARDPPEVVRKRYFSLTMSDINYFQKERMKKWIKVYEKVLGMCFKKIREHVIHDELWCMFNVPEYISGFPIFNIVHCCAFIIRKLRQAGFKCDYIKPNIITIFWSTSYSPQQQHPFQPMAQPVHQPQPQAQPRPQPQHPHPHPQPQQGRGGDDSDVHFVMLKPIDPILLPKPLAPAAPKQTQPRRKAFGGQKEEPFLFN